MSWTVHLCFAIVINYLTYGAAIELTFELPDNAHECFYEDIKQNTTCTLEFQVPSLKDFRLKKSNFYSRFLLIHFTY